MVRRTTKRSLRVDVAGVLLALTFVVTLPGVASGSTNVARYTTVESFEKFSWGLAAIRAGEAWEVSRGAGQVVAVLDTGVDATHPDLDGQVIAGWSSITGITLTTGVNNDGDAHGTHVAGVIAGKSDGSGIVGVAPDARIMPVQVLGEDGSGSDRSVADGIDWAVEQGASVINLSLGGETNPFNKGAGRSCAAVGRAFDAGVVVIVAAGNSGAAGNPRSEPASCRGAVSVAAIDEDLNRSIFSSFDASVGISAPGSSIISSVPSSRRYPFEQWDGTSMAAPFVAGVAALVRAAHPEWDASEVLSALQGTAVDLGPRGKDPEFGAGLVDAAAALGLPDRNIGNIRETMGASSLPKVTDVEANGSTITVSWLSPRNVSLELLRGYRVELFGVLEDGYPTTGSDIMYSVETNVQNSITFPFDLVPSVVRVSAIVENDNGGESTYRVAVPFFDVKNTSPRKEYNSKPVTILSSAASWTTNGLKVTFATTDPEAQVMVTVNAGAGQLFLTRMVSSEAGKVFFPIAADSFARSTSTNVGVSVGLQERYLLVKPQFLISAKALTAGPDTISISGSTVEACNSAKRVACAGSVILLRDSRTGSVIAKTWVIANLRFGFDVRRSDVSETFHVSSGNVRSVTLQRLNFNTSKGKR